MTAGCRTLCSVVLVILTSVAPPAKADNVQEARTYFNAGARAYEAGEFLAAIQAFERAHSFAPRDAIIFTIGQAYRRQYYIDKNPQHLQLAIEHYRDYLQRVPKGGRRADAAQALAELEPVSARIESSEEPVEQPASIQPTRIVLTSSTKGAVITLNNEPPAKLVGGYASLRVEPGKHSITMSAPGFFDEKREVKLEAGSLLALDLALREKPATIDIRVEPNAEIFVDGRLIGTSPLARRINLSSGTHAIVIMKNGRKSYYVETELKPGKLHRLNVDLETTGQRVASHALLTTSAAVLITGGVFTGLALHQQRKAKDIESDAKNANIQPSELLQYNDALNQRNRHRRAAVISFGASAAAGISGFLLHSFDRPSLRSAAGVERLAEPSSQPTSPTFEPSLDLSAIPIWTPELAGGAISGSF